MSVPSNLMSSYATSNSIYRTFLIFLSGTFVVFIFKDYGAVLTLIEKEKESVGGYLFFIPVIFFFGVFVDSISVVIFSLLMYIKEWGIIKRMFGALRVVRAYKELSYHLWPVLSQKLNFRDKIGVDGDYLENMATGCIFVEGDDRIFKWVVGHHLIAVLNRHIFILLSLFFAFSVGGWVGWTLAVVVLLFSAFASIYWHYYIMMSIFRWCYVTLMLKEKGEYT